MLFEARAKRRRARRLQMETWIPARLIVVMVLTGFAAIFWTIAASQFRWEEG